MKVQTQRRSGVTLYDVLLWCNSYLLTTMVGLSYTLCVTTL